MQKNYSSKLLQLFGVGPATAQPATPQARPVLPSAPGALGVDQLGVPVENPIREQIGHCLILGATGTGKSSLVKNLVADLDCRIVWLTDSSQEVSSLEEAIRRHQRFEFPVLLVIDDAHLFAEQLELLELLARDGRRSNIFLLITAQLLSDLPQAIWRNCQIRFAIGPEARKQLKLQSHEQLSAYVAVFSWPGRQGFIRISESSRPAGDAPDNSNPLLRRASKLPLEPYEESAPAHQTPLDQWSKEVLAEPQGLHDRQLGNTDQPHRTRYSRTL